uniref:Uncharacterized protein n=1 Tax=Ananas comosus var. bracteatus TaxID=296719 RepID=A0A6V7P4U5_ANACO|nr:unnamed protein product [Ananas comosus var. bracteatus]
MLGWEQQFPPRVGTSLYQGLYQGHLLGKTKALSLSLQPPSSPSLDPRGHGIAGNPLASPVVAFFSIYLGFVGVAVTGNPRSEDPRGHGSLSSPSSPSFDPRALIPLFAFFAVAGNRRLPRLWGESAAFLGFGRNHYLSLCLCAITALVAAGFLCAIFALVAASFRYGIKAFIAAGFLCKIYVLGAAAFLCAISALVAAGFLCAITALVAAAFLCAIRALVAAASLCAISALVAAAFLYAISALVAAASLCAISALVAVAFLCAISALVGVAFISPQLLAKPYIYIFG